MGEYSPEYAKPDRLESSLGLESDSDGNEGIRDASGTDPEDADSSTDIDAIVEEYKERLKVATTLTGNYSGTMRLPSLASGRRVLIAVILMCIASVALGAGMLYEMPTVVWSAVTVMVIFAGVVWCQPQRPRLTTDATDNTYRIALMPWLPTFALGLNALLAATLMPEIWPGVILWLSAGLILFCRCSCWCCDYDCDCDCDGSMTARHNERIRLRAPPRGSVVSALVPSHQDNANRLTHVDTILIAR